MSKLVFSSPFLRLYPNNKKTSVHDVAVKIEKKYHLLESFYQANRGKITKIIQNEYYRKFNNEKINKSRVNGQMQALWREWLASEAHGIKTKRAKEEGRASFIDTGNYMRFLHFDIEE